ncbi:carnitine dehydratase [Frankia sp. CcI49]|nr:carnitine dehydratase [Frankia sp. CcI49]
MGGIGPVPFCGLLLSDLGADVVRIDRPARPAPDGSVDLTEVISRGRRSVFADLKTPGGRATALKLICRADALMEGYRPGVMEKLGLGPEVCTESNPRLVYARMTGFGQTGPLAQSAGHDINYLGFTGALHAVGTADSGPVPPLNLVADFGGGAMLLALGVVSALVEAARSGKGQIVDAAMVDGTALLMTSVYEFFGRGLWSDERGTNILDSGAHFYNTYRTADAQWLAVGAVEPQFYAALLAGLKISMAAAPQWDRTRWPALRERFAAIFGTRTRDAWMQTFAGVDACCTPVLSLRDAPAHAHNMARDVFQNVDGLIQPAPAPRFSRTPASVSRGAPRPGEHTEEVLQEWL